MINQTLSVEIIKKEVIYDAVQADLFRKELQDQLGTTISESYYNNEPFGLYDYGYKGGSWGTPKRIFKHTFLFKGEHYSDVSGIFRVIENKMDPIRTNTNDTVIFNHPPLLCIQYPVMIGVEWIYRYYQDPWRLVSLFPFLI